MAENSDRVIRKPEDLVEGALYAVRHNLEWHLAIYKSGAFEVVESSWQSGDRWLPEWVEKVVLVDQSPYKQ